MAIVTDAFLLMKHADANIFVVRLGVTHKKIFSSVIRDMEMRDIPHLAILMNDLKLDEGSYGYGYKLARKSQYGQLWSILGTIIRITGRCFHQKS